jgi:hypothetical protein
MVPSDLGLRWQGGSRDTAFGRATPVRTDETVRARERRRGTSFPAAVQDAPRRPTLMPFSNGYKNY